MSPDTRPDPLADAATILGIVLSTSLMSDKHVEVCIEAARPLIAHIEAFGWTLAPAAGVTLTQPQPDAGLRDDLRGLLHEISGDLDARADSGDDISRDLGDRLRAALRSTPAAPTHTPKVMEAEAGRLLVESARIRAARLGPDDAHELRHLWAAINAGNSDPCGETCHLDADAIARWTEQYPKVMGLVALRSTPAAPTIDAAHLARQRAWSESTFGPGLRTIGILDHIAKEFEEIVAEPTSLEWIDVVILALDGAWRAGHEPQEIIDAIVAKQARNEGRTWPDWRTMPPNVAIEHVRSTPAAPKADARSLADRITGVIAIPPDGEVEP